MDRDDIMALFQVKEIIWIEPKVWLEDAGEAERPRWLEKPTVGYVQQV